MKEVRSGSWTPGLTGAEEETLFRIAEDTLAWCVKRRGGTFAFEAYALTPKLKERYATFVTLKMGGDLRGCIGSLSPTDNLYRSVHDNAVNAALKDFRFSPVTAEELPDIEVEISVLSPIEPIASLNEFRLGEHGIIIEKGMNRAVYLPEVAVEQGWTAEETLSSLSMKAGLRPNAWKEGARFRVFSSVKLAKGTQVHPESP
jgi:AmmeMemoRadiSam system protein A